MFIIDFDDTLFNTRPEFKDARIRAVKACGASEELYKKTYDQIKASWPPYRFSNRLHAQLLAQHGHDEERIFAALERTMTVERLKTFLFPDTISFLEKLKRLGGPLVLLSLGDEEFQYAKVRGADLEKYFDRIFFTSDTKEHVVGELMDAVSDKNVWFINDYVAQTQELAKKFPRLKAILKQPPESVEAAYQACGLPYFKTLTEIYDYIAAHQ